MNETGANYIDKTLQAAAVATGVGAEFNCTDLSKGSYKILTLQVTGITTVTITWEGTLDGTTWAAIDVTPMNALDTPATTAAANGLYSVDVTGLTAFRANITAWTEGATTVLARLTAR